MRSGRQLRARACPALFVASVLLILGACGGDGRPEYASEAYVAAMVAEVPDDPGMHCLAPTLVDAFGAEELSLAGITPTAFAAAERLGGLVVEPAEGSVGRLEEALGECIDLEAQLEQELPDELASVQCIQKALDVDRFAESTAESMLLTRFEALDMKFAAVLFADASPACVEEALLTRAIETGQVNEEEAQCLGAHMDDSTTKDYFVEIMADRPADESDALDLVAAVLACGMPMDTSLVGQE